MQHNVYSYQDCIVQLKFCYESRSSIKCTYQKKKREKTFRGDSEAYGLVIIYGDSFMAEYVCLNILRCTHPTL